MKKGFRGSFHLPRCLPALLGVRPRVGAFLLVIDGEDHGGGDEDVDDDHVDDDHVDDVEVVAAERRDVPGPVLPADVGLHRDGC